MERFELLGDGRIAYELRRPRWDGTTHLILEPMELMEKPPFAEASGGPP